MAPENGYLKRGIRISVPLGTTYILGRGSVKDTYNLLANGIGKLMRVMEAVGDVPARRWAEDHGYKRYAGSSVKGEAAIDWSGPQARPTLLGETMADADQLLELARRPMGNCQPTVSSSVP